MGGFVPLGYEAKDRKLVINEAEAATVRMIFERFVAIGSATTLAKALVAEGVRNKRGKPIDKGFLYKLLNNRVYLGEAVHKGTAYAGERESIVSRDLWDKVHSLPIRLLPTPPTCRVLPGSGVKLCVGRCGDVARDAEQGTEGVERIEPPVEAEGEFVEVGLQVLVTDPVMDAVQPRFQVCEDEMDDWQILLGDLRIAPFSDGEVFVAALGKAGVATPVVGDERRARHNGALHEAAEQLRAAVRHDGEPNPPGIATTLPLVELGARLALANLHSAGDKNLIVDATAFAARPAASPGFIDFDVLAGPAADPVLIRAHHPRAELVEDLERRLVARQAKLSPKLHGRHAGCLAGHQIGRPKPYAQRRVRARHDRSHRQSGVTAALAAAQDARTICEAERLSRRLTMGANKPVAPASLLQVGGAGRVVGKKSLELWERLWEPKIATLVNVHEHGRTLPLVAVGDNRIGKVHSSSGKARANEQPTPARRNRLC